MGSGRPASGILSFLHRAADHRIERGESSADPADGSLATLAEWRQLRQVLQVLVPTAIYVVAIPFVGIYLVSAALIAVFMVWLGKYRWSLTAAISIGVTIAIYLMFEKFFLVPLPKGPLEELLYL